MSSASRIKRWCFVTSVLNTVLSLSSTLLSLFITSNNEGIEYFFERPVSFINLTSRERRINDTNATNTQPLPSSERFYSKFVDNTEIVRIGLLSDNNSPDRPTMLIYGESYGPAGGPMLPSHCKVVGKLHVEGAITEEAIQERVVGKRGYKLTEFYCVTNGDDWAVISVKKGPGARLLVPVERVEVLSLPHETEYVLDPSVDTTNPTAMYGVARRFDGDVKTVVVQGEFNHMSFVVRDGAEACVRVLDVVPPYPSKVAALAHRGLACRPIPVVLEEETIDLRDLARDIGPEVRVLFPCRASGLELDRDVDYLDEVPDLADNEEVVLVGCNLSERIFKEHYGRRPSRNVSMCPKELALARDDGRWTLVKCCKEKGPFGIHGKVVAIPWSATKGDAAAALEEIYDRVIEERLNGLRGGSCGCQSCHPEHL